MLARSTTAPLREVNLGSLAMNLERRPDGTIRARSPFPLPAFDDSVTARLDHWARVAPDRVFLAQRDKRDAWRSVTFGEARTGARALGQALLDRGLSAENPLVILSGNSLAHALLALGALYAGVPYAPLSPGYARVAQDFSRLKQIAVLLTPGLIFAEDADDFAAAIGAAVPENVEIVTAHASSGLRKTTDFASLLATAPGPTLDAAHTLIGPGTIAKILFTSGSTDAPKAVITTHRMLCANQTMIAQALPFLRSQPPVLVDWLPWHHSFGGNHNFGIVLHHGGTLYIDSGRPTETGIADTLRALRDISPTLFFNVPRGFEMLLPHLARDRGLAQNFFRSLKLNFFAGASLSDRTIAGLDEIAIAACGERIATISGYGATETAPSILFQTDQKPVNPAVGRVGLPLPGNELKLVPIKGDAAGAYEARIRGPNVTPGYWRDDALTRQAFDDEGFFCLGDALRLADGKQPQLGFLLAGRLGETFKLTSGTTVSASAVRARLVAAGAPYIRDAVIAGENRDRVTALVFPDLIACRAGIPDLSASAPAAEILIHPAVQEIFHGILAGLAARAGGASERITGVALLVEPASNGAGEITDKGTLNPRAVLKRRADAVNCLYASAEPASIVVSESLIRPR